MAEAWKEKSTQSTSERSGILQNIYIYKTEMSMNGTHEGEFRV